MRRCATFAGFVALLSATVVMVSRAEAVTHGFDVGNHPDGIAAPPHYGLRLDHSAQFNLFDFKNVVGLLNTDTGDFLIQGIVWHATAQADDYSGQIFYLDALLHLDIPADNFASLVANTASPTLNGNTEYLALTLLDNDGVAGAAADFNGNQVAEGDTFSSEDDTYYVNAEMGGHGFHMRNNHRGVSGLSGWGWVSPDGQGHTASQDWLFTLQYTEFPTPPPPLTPIPEPASATLVLMGLAGMAWKKIRP